MAAPEIILLVDDDNDVRTALAEQLKACKAFEVIEASDATTGIKQAHSERVDLVLLNIAAAGMDGREVCKQMRASGVYAPIIMLTASDSDSSPIPDCENRPDDYMVKPFKLSVLLACVRTHLDSFRQSEAARFRIGPYEFHPGLNTLTDADQSKIPLTGKETNILTYLCKADGKVVTRDTLLAKIWGYGAGINTHTLETHIYRLRQKIEPDPVNARFLLTETNGYRLIR